MKKTIPLFVALYALTFCPTTSSKLLAANTSCTTMGCSGETFVDRTFTPARAEALSKYYEELPKTETNVDAWARLVTKPARTDLEKIFLLWRASRLKNLGHVSLTPEEIEAIRQNGGDAKAFSDAWYEKILRTQTAVCYESAHLFARMANSLGFSANVISGDFRRPERFNWKAPAHEVIGWYDSPHAWARVKLQGKYYHLDAQGLGFFLAPYSMIMGSYRPYSTDAKDRFNALSKEEFLQKSILRSEDGTYELRMKRIPGLQIEIIERTLPLYPTGQKPNLYKLGTVATEIHGNQIIFRFRLPQEGQYVYDMKVTYAGAISAYLPLVVDTYAAVQPGELYPKIVPHANRNVMITDFRPKKGVLAQNTEHNFFVSGPGLEEAYLEFYDDQGDPKSFVLKRSGGGFAGKVIFKAPTTVTVRTRSRNSKGAQIHHAPLTYEIAP